VPPHDPRSSPPRRISRATPDGRTSLLRTAAWEQRERRIFRQMFTEPRLTAEYPAIAAAPTPILASIAGALADRYDAPYDGLWMNFYRDNNDSAGWHADRPANRPETAIVSVLSLGARRRLLIKHKDGGASTRY
jgi:alkylated DNA repair dioxygenase AlkB